MRTTICLALLVLLATPQTAALSNCSAVRSEFIECLDEETPCPNSIRFNLWRCLGRKCAMAENTFYWQKCYQLGTDYWKCDILYRKLKRACYIWD